jgi:hypothetical protein
MLQESRRSVNILRYLLQNITHLDGNYELLDAWVKAKSHNIDFSRATIGDMIVPRAFVEG